MKTGALVKATKTKVETVRYYEKIGLFPPQHERLQITGITEATISPGVRSSAVPEISALL